MKKKSAKGLLTFSKRFNQYLLVEKVDDTLKTKTIWFTLIAFCIAITCIFSTGCKKDTHKETALENEINQLRKIVAPYTDKKNAVAAGYNTDVTGYRTQMGHHFLNGELLDDKFELGKPELMLYAPYGNDTMKLVAVEYATPISDLNHPPPVPEGFTGSEDIWEINTEFKLWTLHVWIGLDNPHGLFASHNPKLP